MVDRHYQPWSPDNNVAKKGKANCLNYGCDNKQIEDVGHKKCVRVNASISGVRRCVLNIKKKELTVEMGRYVFK